jgi:putative ABC transport system substrate-binding protein
MRRRDFITLVGGTAATWPLNARAQSRTLTRVGFLRQAGPDDKQFDAFRGGLRAVGYLEGQNIVIEQRYAAGAYDRLPALAMELVLWGVFRAWLCSAIRATRRTPTTCVRPSGLRLRSVSTCGHLK